MSVFGEQDIICQYYIKQNQVNITCEGMLPDSNIFSEVHFESQREKKKHIQSFCNTHTYRTCPCAQGIERKYK